jgi:hypothetical protein
VQKFLSALIIARTVQLSTMLAEAGDTPENLVPVAGETGRGPLVSALRATGRAAYRSNRSQRPVSQPPPGLGTKSDALTRYCWPISCAPTPPPPAIACRHRVGQAPSRTPCGPASNGQLALGIHRSPGAGVS